MDALTLFGLFAVSMMLITYAFEWRSLWLDPKVCRGLCACVYLWLSSGRVALRIGRSRVDARRASPLAAVNFKLTLCQRLASYSGQRQAAYAGMFGENCSCP